MFTTGSLKCVALLAITSVRVACASDVEVVRQWLVEEATRAQSDKLGFCVDVSWTKYTAPLYSDEEFVRKWQSAVNRPDHPDKYMLLMDKAKREGDVGSPIRVLYASRDMLRESFKTPALTEELIFSTLAPLESTNKSVDLRLMQGDHGTSHGKSWQASNSSIAVMSVDKPTFNPQMRLQHANKELFTIIFGGVELHNPSVWKSADIKLRGEKLYEVSFSTQGDGVSKAWTYEITWSSDYQRCFVMRHTGKAIINNEDRVMRNSYFDWTPADGGGSFFAARSILQEGGRPKEGSTSPAILKEDSRIETSSASVVDCEFVEKASTAPEMKDSTDGFVVLDPVRGEWLAVRHIDVDGGVQRVMRNPGSPIEEPVRTSGSQSIPRESMLKRSWIWVVASILGVGAIGLAIRHRYSNQ